MMLGIEEVLCELNGQEINSQGLPPGFRFHPTDVELLTIYLASKLCNNNALHAVHIAEVDLNRCEPWDLPDVAKMGEREWYFFSLRDRKYPTGLRTNRATGAGYWKATGKDKEVYSSDHNHSPGLIGMKKTLVFYKGRAPRGHKTKWVMHEYRLHPTYFSSAYRHISHKEEWVICRIHHKTGDKKSQPCLLDHQGPPTNCLPALLEYRHDQSQNPMHTMHIQQQYNTNFLIHDHQQNDLKNLILNNPVINVSQSHPLFHPINNGFQIQPSFSPTPPTNITTSTNYKNNPSSPLQSILFKSLFSHEQQQDSTSHDISKLQKQCKTEDNFSSQLEMPAANFNYANNFNYLMMNEKNHQNPWLFDDLEYSTVSAASSVFGFPSAATTVSAEATTVDHAETSPSNRVGFQTIILDT